MTDAFVNCWSLSFITHLIVVMIPGRYDDSTSPYELSWRDNLFAPADFAFLIWPLIYVGEVILTILVVNYSSSTTVLFEAITPFWALANLAQVLWCLTFRRNCPLIVSTIALFVAVAALDKVHSELTTHLMNFSFEPKWRIVAMRFPISLHLGWLMAASLLNLNILIGTLEAHVCVQVSCAFVSIILSLVAGCLWTLVRNDPVIALTLAWAVNAIAVRTRGSKGGLVASRTKDTLWLTEVGVVSMLSCVGVVEFISMTHEMRAKLLDALSH